MAVSLLPSTVPSKQFLLPPPLGLLGWSLHLSLTNAQLLELTYSLFYPQLHYNDPHSLNTLSQGLNLWLQSYSVVVLDDLTVDVCTRHKPQFCRDLLFSVSFGHHCHGHTLNIDLPQNCPLSHISNFNILFFFDVDHFKSLKWICYIFGFRATRHGGA